MRPTTISQKVLVDFFTAEKKLEQPRRKRDGSKCFPLWCAMLSIPKSIKDQGREMDAIHAGMARYPFKTWNASGYELERRLTKHRRLTWLQHHYLLTWIASRYQGSYRDMVSDYFHVDGIKTPVQKTAAWEVDQYVRDALKKCGMTERDLPLRTILSGDLESLIRILFTEFYLRKKK